MEISIFLITQSLDVILNYNQILDLDWGPREKSCPGAPHALKTALDLDLDICIKLILNDLSKFES